MTPKQSIQLHNIRLYAHHGCLKEETLIGSHYQVHTTLYYDMTRAMYSDDLSDTIDYGVVHKIISEEMAVPSKLLEHVAHRIIQRFQSTFTALIAGDISIAKLCPPIDGDVEKVSVCIAF